MCLIFDRVPHMTLAQCLDVSSVWRQRLLAYPGCWRRIHIDEEERYGDLSDARSVHRVLSLASHHIREISFAASSSMPAICMESIKTKNVSNLQSLRIQGANN
ncbi:hypothetical protein BJV82DRAFT_576180 [Fennellomyces sp. T-0311]|nr:hypothetical protein BJV82DRAFT_576180 [Fennellomyces sp. T-0311]